jgi:hypothetical protein
MKAKLIAVFSLSLVSSGYSATIKDFIGSWKGTRVEYVDGIKYSGTETISFKKQGSDLIETVTINIAGHKFTGTARFYSNKTCTSQLYYKGNILAVSSGTWVLDGDTITLNETVNEIGIGLYDAQVTAQIIGKKKLVSVSTNASGSISVTLKKI